MKLLCKVGVAMNKITTEHVEFFLTCHGLQHLMKVGGGVAVNLIPP